MRCHGYKTGWVMKMTFLSSGKHINMASKRLGIINSVIIILLILVSASVSAADRASFGVMIRSVTAEYAQFIGLDTPEGVYVVSTLAAGDLRPGDVILKVDDRSIKSPTDLQEVTRIHQPGDQVQLQIARGKERIQISYTLKSAAVLQGKVRPDQSTQASTGLGSFPTVESARFEQEVLKSDQPVLAYFYANWCAPCKMYLPVLQQAREQYPEIKIVGIDVDKSSDIVFRYGISRVLPTVILFNGGSEVDKFSGGVSRKQVDELVAKTRNDSNEIEVFPSVGRGDYIVQVAFIKNSPLIAARDDGQRVFVWNYQQGALVRTYRAAATGLSPDGAYVALTDKNRTAVHIVDIVQQQKKTIQTQQFVEKLAISPLGTAVASFGADQSGQFSVNIWSPDNRLIKSIPVDRTTNPQSVMFVFSPDGTAFALSTLNKLELFATKNWTRETVVPMKGTAPVLQFTSDSKAVLVAGGVIDLQGKKQRGSDGRVVVGRPDDRLFVVGNGDNSFRLVSNHSDGKGLRFVGHRAGVTAAAVGDAVPWLASGSPDGTVRFWDQATGRAVGQFVGFGNGEWIVITPEGYYNSSLNGHKYLNIRMGNKVYGIEQFYDVFYRPDIVTAKLRGEDISSLITLTIDDAIKNPPPTVEFASVPSETDQSKVKVCYQVKSTGGGIGEVRVFHNGKLIESDGYYKDVAKTSEKMQLASLTSNKIYEDMRSVKIKGIGEISPIKSKVKGEQFEDCKQVDAVQGENEISLSAFNSSNTVQSYMQTAKFNSTIKPEEPHLYILSIGIDQYKDKSVNLKYALKDAKDIKEKLLSQSVTLYKPRNIHHELLTDKDATKTNILNKINEISQKIKPSDSFILFVAGHGILLQNQYYMLTSEYDGNINENTMISSNEIVEMSKKIKSLSQLFIFDTCHAGGVDYIVSGLYDARMSVLAKKMGLHIYASANDKQAAMDGYKGNGLFTYTLLDGLNNKKEADKNNDKKVSLIELGEYSKMKTGEASKAIGHTQTPLIINFGKDNPVYNLR